MTWKRLIRVVAAHLCVVVFFLIGAGVVLLTLPLYGQIPLLLLIIYFGRKWVYEVLALQTFIQAPDSGVYWVTIYHVVHGDIVPIVSVQDTFNLD